MAWRCGSFSRSSTIRSSPSLTRLRPPHSSRRLFSSITSTPGVLGCTQPLHSVVAATRHMLVDMRAFCDLSQATLILIMPLYLTTLPLYSEGYSYLDVGIRKL